ncbi:helix-turn-helix transcriptional regulator [Chryseobacterium scophthalmum]|uniref:LexA family transcriptional regulator n=1 Tax=Chryseobacterium scophthalmum TaxID=59733 RepID=UPI000C9E6D53|nr:helix-turn-helix domain-containing protein [Chryseobacterium scophthalmum]
MNDINFRIKSLIDTFSQGNNSNFAEKIGVSEGNIRSYLKGTEPKFNVIKKICESFEISYEWLISGKGTMEKTISNDLIIESKPPLVITVDSHNVDNIVFVPQKLKAGYLTGHDDPKFVSKLPTYRMPGLNNGIFRMFEIEGNSMFPTLPNRSIVVGQYVENWTTGIKDNKLYAIISNEVEDGLVKRCVNRIKKYNNLMCKSDNRRNYPTQNVDPSTIKEVWEVKLHLNFELPDPADIYDRMNDFEAQLEELKRKINK